VSDPLARLAARAIRATALVDTAYRRFDGLRSVLVARFASDGVLDAFNDLTYGASAVYRPDAPNYRSELFHWEIEAIGRAFPAAPARVLVGGAGGGREAFALAARGYEVVAFEPSPQLAGTMALHAAVAGPVTACIGRYEDLPTLQVAAEGAGSIDLRQLPVFGAAMFGWSSYSHIRYRKARVVALREMAAVTDGPVVVSFYLGRAPARTPQSRLQEIVRRLGLGGSFDRFTTHVGFYHLSTAEELHAEARDAGLEVVHECYDDLDGRWPYVVLRRRA
jgi:hypothetical protein